MNRKLLTIYGLKWNPFTPDIPDDALWPTPQIDHFCWRVEHHVRDGGFALLSGESGTGKSITLRLLARHLAALPDVSAGVLTRPQSGNGRLLPRVGRRLWRAAQGALPLVQLQRLARPLGGSSGHYSLPARSDH